MIRALRFRAPGEGLVSHGAAPRRAALVLIAAAALCAALLCGCSGASDENAFDLHEEGVLTVGTALDYPPFDTEKDDQPCGYDVAVVREAASRLGLEARFKDVGFEECLQCVSDGGSCDIAAAALTITDEREERVDFTDAYGIVDQAVVMLKSSTLEASGLSGAKVAVRTGTPSETYAKETLGAETVPLLGVHACFDALRSGATRALVVDWPVARCLVQGTYADCAIAERVTTGDRIGIAVSKGNPRLTEALNRVLDEMEQDGTLDRLQKEYLS